MAKRAEQPKPDCTVDGCGKPQTCRGWCDTHYSRWKRTGDVRADKPPKPRTPKSEQDQWLNETAATRSPLNPACWEWPFTRDRAGYGGHPDGPAHRISYERFIGPIPDGLVIDHLCRNPGCVNPRHLEPVPIATNVMRGVGLGATAARATHCIHGHPWDEQNTYIRKDNGTRQCRECIKIRLRRYYREGRIGARSR